MEISPFNAMGRGEHVSVIDEGSSTIESVEIGQPDHPRILVHFGGLSSHNPSGIVGFTTT